MYAYLRTGLGLAAQTVTCYFLFPNQPNHSYSHCVVCSAQQPCYEVVVITRFIIFGDEVITVSTAPRDGKCNRRVGNKLPVPIT